MLADTREVLPVCYTVALAVECMLAELGDALQPLSFVCSVEFLYSLELACRPCFGYRVCVGVALLFCVKILRLLNHQCIVPFKLGGTSVEIVYTWLR